MTNHQPADAPNDETSLPKRMSDCRSPFEKSIWQALEIARKERDEARADVCRLLAEIDPNSSARQHAEDRGWDCFMDQTP